MPWPAYVWAAALEAVIVRGTSACPSPSDVAAKLAPLVRASNHPADVGDISRQGSTLWISLSRAYGRHVGTQTVEGTDCDDLAEAAAVILASWENDEARRDGLSLSPPAAPSEIPRSPRRRTWDVALGVGGVLADQAFSPAVMANGSLAPGAGALGVRLGGGFAGWGTVELPHGQVHWNRFMIGGGPKLAWATSSLVAEGHVGAYLGWVRSTGEAFSDNRSDGGLEFSFMGAARFSMVEGGVQPWIEGALAVWPSPVVAYELPTQAEARLPAWGVYVLAGVLFGR